MQLRHQRRQIAVRRDQVVSHVERMAGRITKPLDAADAGEMFQKPRQRPGPAVRSRAVIRVDVLADEGDFAHAGVGKPLDLGTDLVHGARRFGTARKRHDAEGAELVAAFLHRDEGSDAAPAHGGAARRRQMIELVVDRKLGIDRVALALGARDQAGQMMIVLRTDDDVDCGRAADDFFALGLRNAAGHRDQDAPVVGRGVFFQPAHAAEFGIDLFGGLLADVAGVENDEIGVFRRRGLDIAFRRQSVRHTL